ncbi:PrpR N-terminal domain-containing protein, partial [uncultured Pseudomonas sp.]|uniref:PrpR N-terminal domain-containing protein n=1 Tax=uncultured Pseudomonas sp. TaxID=114707 RepID=UPI00258EEBD8
MNAEPNPSVSADLSGRIAVIAPSRTLTLTMEALLARRGLALPVVEAVQGDALRTAQHLLDQGAVVLISRGKTAHRLREHFRVPVVELRHTFFDCI